MENISNSMHSEPTTAHTIQIWFKALLSDGLQSEGGVEAQPHMETDRYWQYIYTMEAYTVGEAG